MTTLWRDELERKTHKAILHAMGESVPPSRSSMDSQMGTRKERQFDHLEEDKVKGSIYNIASPLNRQGYQEVAQGVTGAGV